MSKNPDLLTGKPVRRVYSYFYPPPNLLSCSESSSSLTKQSFKDECDINNIVAKYLQTGVLGNPLDSNQPFYGDFSSVPDYRDALDLVLRVDEYFHALPAEIRSRFSNNPEQLFQFLNDPVNRDEAVKLGLCVPKKSSDSVADDSNVDLDSL